MQNQIPEIAIISAFKSNLSRAKNKNRHLTLKNILDDLGLKYKIVEGTYKGYKKLSIMVYLHYSIGRNEYLIKDIAINQFNQESILYRDKYKMAYLIYDNAIEKLGTMIQITPEQAAQLDSYTWIPLTDIYMGVLNEC